MGPLLSEVYLNATSDLRNPSPLNSPPLFPRNPKNNEVAYAKLPPEGYLINFIGVLLAVFCCLVVFLLSHSGYRRPALPEDEMLLRDTVID